MKEIVKVSISSCARVLACVMTIIGFFAGIFAAFFSMGSCHTRGYTYHCLIQLCPLHSDIKGWAIIVFPIVYAIIGLICGWLGAIIYNFIAKWTGGIEIDFKDTGPQK